jgi:hypothetical protein
MIAFAMGDILSLEVAEGAESGEHVTGVSLILIVSYTALRCSSPLFPTDRTSFRFLKQLPLGNLPLLVMKGKHCSKGLANGQNGRAFAARFLFGALRGVATSYSELAAKKSVHGCADLSGCGSNLSQGFPKCRPFFVKAQFTSC